MSSMTETLAPPRLGAQPLRFAIPSPTYWDSLREEDRHGSINPNKSRSLGRKTGWLPAGVVLHKWTQQVYPMIRTIFEDAGNHERIYGRHNKEMTQPCRLYMVGEDLQWRSARPTIVALCSKVRIAQRICGLLRDIECMRRMNLGFDYMAHKERLVLIGGGHARSNSSSNLSGNLCGLRVLASTYPPSLDSTWKQTTIGGTLFINRDYYCLSVGHSFRLRKVTSKEGGTGSSSDTDDTSDASDDFYSVSEHKQSVSVVACRPSRLEDIDLGLYQTTVLERTRLPTQSTFQKTCTPASKNDVVVIASGKARQKAIPTLRSLLLCTKMDWVLIRVKDPKFFGPNLVRTPRGTMLSPQRVSPSAPRGKVVVAAGMSGVFESSSPGIIGGLTLPGSATMIDVWTIEALCCMHRSPPTLEIADLFQFQYLGTVGHG